MQRYREYSSTEYYNSSTGSNGGYDMASDWATGGGQYGQNLMMPGRKKQAQQCHYNQSQAHSSYGMADDYAMSKVNHYGEYGQGYNSGGNVVPYAAGHDHMSNAQYNQKYMSKANARYGGIYGSGQGVMTGNGGGFGGGGGGGGGAHYLAKQQHQYASGEMGYVNGMNQKKMHRQRKSEKSMFHQMKTMSVSSSSSTSSRGNYSTRNINHSTDDEYYSGSDGNDSGTDSEYYDSDSDNDRRRSHRPIY